MDELKKNLKDWMKAKGKSRQWVAEKCFVSKGTVDNWLSESGSIPHAKGELIRLLMASPSSPLVAVEQSTLSITFPQELYEVMERSALNAGMTLRDYIACCLEYATRHPELEPEIRSILSRCGQISSTVPSKSPADSAAQSERIRQASAARGIRERIRTVRPAGIQNAQ